MTGAFLSVPRYDWWAPLSHPYSCMLVNYGPSQQSSKDEYKPWKINEVLLQDTTHLIQRPCYQRGSPCKDPAGNRTTRRPPGGKETHLSVSALRPAFSWKLCAIEISCIIIIKVQQIQKRGKVTLRVQQTQKCNRIVKEDHWQGKLNKAILEVNGEGKAGQSDIVGFRKTKRLTKTYEFTVKESLTK